MGASDHAAYNRLRGSARRRWTFSAGDHESWRFGQPERTQFLSAR